jgi:diguanylate cyclase (GGDEF)-like protein
MKKKILLIIATIIIITTIIRTVILSGTFYNFSKTMVINQSNIIRTILYEVIDKERFIRILRDSNEIKEIKLVPKRKKEIHFDFIDKKITVYLPFNDIESLKIVYTAKDFMNEVNKTFFYIILLGLVSLIIIILIVNYFITPYLNVLEEIDKVTKEIIKGNFDQMLITKLSKSDKTFIDNYNYFLHKLNESFGVIEQKYTNLIEKEKTNDPLDDIKTTIEELANIFAFKKIIEEDKDYEIVLKRLIEIFESYNLRNFAIIAIDKDKHSVIKSSKAKDLCCNIEQNYQDCRTYRTLKPTRAIQYKNVCQLHYCDNHYICIPFNQNGNIFIILKIMFESQEDFEKIKTILPYIKTYLEESVPIIEAKYDLELLHMQTIKDPLTRLFNRRYLEDMLPNLIEQAKRKEYKIGFLMLDMDYFKNVNDTYGHDVGDRILKSLGEIIKTSIRKSDIAIRYGGEEFLILLIGIKSKEELSKIAEKIKERVEKYPFRVNDGKTIHKTVSIGGALFPDDCSLGMECIKIADNALYEAKKERNKIVIV